MEAAVPAILVLAIIGIGVVKISDGDARSRQDHRNTEHLAEVTKKDAINACGAVHASDVNFHDFLQRSILTGPRSDDPNLRAFLDALATSQTKLHNACLHKADPTTYP